MLNKFMRQLTAITSVFTLLSINHVHGVDKKPNILVIMADDVGWFNIGAYHRGIMSGKTPNLDKLASQGMLFTDYYADFLTRDYKKENSAYTAFTMGSFFQSVV